MIRRAHTQLACRNRIAFSLNSLWHAIPVYKCYDEIRCVSCLTTNDMNQNTSLTKQKFIAHVIHLGGHFIERPADDKGVELNLHTVRILVTDIFTVINSEHSFHKFGLITISKKRCGLLAKSKINVPFNGVVNVKYYRIIKTA